MPEAMNFASAGNDNTQSSRQPKLEYHRPQLTKYGELASLTQGGTTAQTAEFSSILFPSSN